MRTLRCSSSIGRNPSSAMRRIASAQRRPASVSGKPSKRVRIWMSAKGSPLCPSIAASRERVPMWCRKEFGGIQWLETFSPCTA